RPIHAFFSSNSTEPHRPRKTASIRRASEIAYDCRPTQDLPFRSTQRMAKESTQIIYSMVRVTKTYDKRVVLKDITLGYYYGAKIGVLGLNGSGKSSLLRIMAGVDKEYEGE